ncbi:MAG: hypothetical protein K0Q50_3113 [Vampirovibrio sp.]|jgi:c-di-GMP-binding flagellar brake protein YcgR|nr:hypothetical protein [Vampirovibrio sp.]
MLSQLQAALAIKCKVQVTVWNPADESVEYTFPSYIMATDELAFMVAPPTIQQNQIVPLLTQNMVVGVVLETYPNPFIFYPVIHSLPTDIQGGYWLKIPPDSQVELIQQRKHVRIPMVLPIEVDYTLGDKNIRMQARTEDVSGGGLRFTSITQFRSGQELLLHVQFAPSQPIMHLKTRVVFSAQNRVKRQPDDLYATACQFTDMDNKQEMLIVRECFRRELGLKR